MKFIIKNLTMISLLTNGVGLTVANITSPPTIATITLDSPNLMLMGSNKNNLSNSTVEPLLKSALERADMISLTEKQIENTKINLEQNQIQALAKGQEVTTKATTTNAQMQVNLKFNSKASPYKHFVVFGDSLSDTGEFNRLLKIVSFGLLKMSGVFYHGVSFSNGPVTVQDLSQMLNFKPLQLPEFYDSFQHRDLFPFDKSNYNINYSTAGATISAWSQDTEPFGFVLIKNEGENQIQNFIKNYRLPKNEDQSVIGGYFLGANDFWLNKNMINIIKDQQITNEKFVKDIENTITTIQKSAYNQITELLTKQTSNHLSKNYVQHLLVGNIPDLGKLPGLPFHISRTRISFAAAYWNKQYANMIKELQTKFPGRITPILLNKYSANLKKTFQYQNNINVSPVKEIFNPLTHSLDAIRSASIGNTALSHYFYFDGIHASSTVNYEAANLIYNDLYGWNYH